MNEVPIKPLGPRVLCERLEVVERRSKEGLYVPTTGMEPTYKNLIIAIGDDVTKPVIVGDTVLTTQYVGDEVVYGSDNFYLIEEDHLLAIITMERVDT